MELFLRAYLPVYLVLYLLMAFVLPTWRTWKKTGINPVTFGQKDNAHDYIGFVMKLLIVLLFVVVVSHSAGGRIYSYSSPIAFLQRYWICITGLVLIHLSLVWISIAQFQMSTSWRIGIDVEHKAALKTTGLFSVSRNPVFLGMMISMLGMFLVLPNAITFCLVLLTYFVIQIQIRLEEAFLEQQHGEAYIRYKKTVRRLI